VQFALNKLNKEELKGIEDENGDIKVVCEFCKTERFFLQPN